MGLTTDRTFSVGGVDFTSHLVDASATQNGVLIKNTKQGIANHTYKRGKPDFTITVKLEQEFGTGNLDEAIQAWLTAGTADIIVKSASTGGITYTGPMIFGDYMTFAPGDGDTCDEFELTLKPAGEIVVS